MTLPAQPYCRYCEKIPESFFPAGWALGREFYICPDCLPKTLSVPEPKKEIRG